ncbi:MAG: type IV pilus modification protein PilV [Betaproteobacteria bacterium]|nr:type IV pilus modification protein PilV [Betaproteobacteria bacterium]
MNLSDQAALPSVSCRRERGFSIIEVMITVFVLCLGLLGVGGLQYLSMKSNQSALSRAIATEYAYQMLDFIRSNPAVTTDGLDNFANPECGGFVGMCEPGYFDFHKTHSDSGSRPATMPSPGADDIWAWVSEWLANLKRDLPDAWVSVCRSTTMDLPLDPGDCSAFAGNTWPGSASAPPDTRYYVVTVQWQQAGTQQTGDQWDLFSTGQQQIVMIGEVQ